MNSRLRRYLLAIDLGDMDYFYDWWSSANRMSQAKRRLLNNKWRPRIQRLRNHE